MLISNQIKETIESYFEEDIQDSDRNIYFNIFYVNKDFSNQNLNEIAQHITKTNHSVTISESDDFKIIRVNETPILWKELSQDRWLVVYTSSINRRIRDKISGISNKYAWIEDYWIESGIIDEIYHEYSPDDESVNIERNWDPYWIYQQTSEIPDHLSDYYRENIDEFVEQEIEFNLKTPKWMVDEALEEGVQQELLEKSEISKTRFVFESSSEQVAHDGGHGAATVQSNVTVRQGGQVVHRTGQQEASYRLLDQIDSKSKLYESLESVTGDKEFKKQDSGILTPQYGEQSGVLRMEFVAKGFNEESNIKLSNLLTVGHSDVNIRGEIKGRGELWFYCGSTLLYDGEDFQAIFAGTDDEGDTVLTPDGDNANATLFIKSNGLSTSGLLYLYRKLSEKFDPRIEVDTSDELPPEIMRDILESGGV